MVKERTKPMIKSFRQTMPFICICVILIAFAFTGCGTNNALTERRPALAKIKQLNEKDGRTCKEKTVLKREITWLNRDKELIRAYYC